MILKVNHQVVTNRNESMISKVVLYLLVTLAVLLTLCDPYLEYLCTWRLWTTFYNHLVFVFDTVAVT